MHLELSEIQAKSLRDALTQYLEQFEFELARTENRDLRHELRQRFDTLDELSQRLARLLSEESPAEYA